MFCHNCGSKISDGSSFCPMCGQQINATNPNQGNGQYASDMQYNTGTELHRKQSNNTGLVVLIVALALVLLIVLAVVFFVMSGNFLDIGSSNYSRSERIESLKTEEDREEYAMEVAEDFYEDTMSLAVRVFSSESAYEFIDNIEGIGEFFEDRYPKEVAEAIYSGPDFNEFKEMLDELKNMDKDELEEEYEDFADDQADMKEEAEELLRAINVKAEGARKLDEDELEDIRERIEDDIDKEIDEFEWGYKVEVEISSNIYEGESVEGYYYVIYADDKCGVYAVEVDGEISIITDSIF